MGLKEKIKNKVKKSNKVDDGAAKPKKGSKEEKAEKKKLSQKEKDKAALQFKRNLADRTQERSLEMMPLSCCNSCFLHQAIYSSIIFQALANLAGVFFTAQRLYATGFWLPLATITTSNILTHPILGLLFLGYSGVWAAALLPLYWGMRGFDAKQMKIHAVFQVASMVVSGLGAVVSVVVLFMVSGDQLWRPLCLIVTFAFTIFVHAWTISMIRDALDYFKMCAVLADPD